MNILHGFYGVGLVISIILYLVSGLYISDQFDEFFLGLVVLFIWVLAPVAFIFGSLS